MVKENCRINNEFYVDSMPVFYKKLGLNSVIFDVDLYVGWGKPSDLLEYQHKEQSPLRTVLFDFLSGYSLLLVKHLEVFLGG